MNRFLPDGIEAIKSSGDMRSSRKLTGLIAVFVAVLAIVPHQARAQNQDMRSYTFDTYVRWLAQYKGAKPAFKPGDVLTAADIEKMRPFVPPGFIEELNFPEFKAPIIAARDNSPRRDYLDCTEKHQNQVKLNPDGSMANYYCGQPFSNSQLDPNDPKSGFKVAWNWNFRWQDYGITKCAPVVTWDTLPGTHRGYAPPYGDVPADWAQAVGGYVFEHPDTAQEIAAVYGGGGSLQRTLQLFYSRLYYSHLAPLADKGGVLPIQGAKELEYKEFVGFFMPYDIRGTAFITYRYEDPNRADDAWAYLPALRRVRRISVEVKSDSLLGTDHTLEDFYSFTGRVLEWKWRFLGWKDVLSVMNSKYDFSRQYGPKGIVPDDQWEVRRFSVVERIPKYPRHVYSRVINFWDAQNQDAFYEIAFDRTGRLWKLWFYTKRWTEDYTHPFLANMNHGVFTTDWQGVDVEDVQNSRATVWPCYCSYGTPDLAKLPAFLDVNTLERVHR